MTNPKRPFVSALIILAWTLAVIVAVFMFGGIVVATIFRNSDEAYWGLTLLFMLFAPIALSTGFILAVKRFIKDRRAQRSMAASEKICSLCGRPRPASEDFCPYCTAPPAPQPPRTRSPSASVDTGLVTRWGGGQDNPTVDELRAALAELNTPDTEHPSAWLSDDDGWTVDVYETGLVIFSHQGEDICERRGVPREEALELWLLLLQGKRDEIKQRLSA
jgi:hypothetical protein